MKIEKFARNLLHTHAYISKCQNENIQNKNYNHYNRVQVS